MSNIPTVKLRTNPIVISPDLKIVVDVPFGKDPTIALKDVQSRGTSIHTANLVDMAFNLTNGRPAGIAHLQYLFNQQNIIPEEWKDVPIAFTGTILQNPNGERYILLLKHKKDQNVWYVEPFSLDRLLDLPGRVAKFTNAV